MSEPHTDPARDLRDAIARIIAIAVNGQQYWDEHLTDVDRANETAECVDAADALLASEQFTIGPPAGAPNQYTYTEPDPAAPVTLTAMSPVSGAVGDRPPAEREEPQRNAFLVYSECGHEPVTLWWTADERGFLVGDYGVCTCDTERERKVTRVEPVETPAPKEGQT